MSNKNLNGLSVHVMLDPVGDADLINALMDLKRELFFDKNWAVLYREILKKGIEADKASKAGD